MKQPIHDKISKFREFGFRNLRGMPNKWDEGGIKTSDRTTTIAIDRSDFEGFRIVKNNLTSNKG